MFYAGLIFFIIGITQGNVALWVLGFVFMFLLNDNKDK